MDVSNATEVHRIRNISIASDGLNSEIVVLVRAPTRSKKSSIIQDWCRSWGVPEGVSSHLVLYGAYGATEAEIEEWQLFPVHPTPAFKIRLGLHQIQCLEVYVKSWIQSAHSQILTGKCNMFFLILKCIGVARISVERYRQTRIRSGIHSHSYIRLRYFGYVCDT